MVCTYRRSRSAGLGCKGRQIVGNSRLVWTPRGSLCLGACVHPSCLTLSCIPLSEPDFLLRARHGGPVCTLRPSRVSSSGRPPTRP
eukprot:12421672-Karenia_brevis.AAC.1